MLDLDEPTYKAARELLIEAGLLEEHHRRTAPSHGFLLPPGWEPLHVPHLRRLARNLLADEGVVTERGGRIRFLPLIYIL